MTSDQLLYGSAGSFVLSLVLLYASRLPGELGTAAMFLGLGLFVLSVIGISAHRIWRVLALLKR